MNPLSPISGALLAIMVAMTSAPAQVDPKTQAQDLAGNLQADLEGNATRPVTADTVPGYVTDDPAETTYFDAPDTIEGAATSASVTHESAVAVRESVAVRPVVEDGALAAFLDLGFAAQNDPEAYVSAFSGTYGDCEEIEIGPGPETYYLRTCNIGVIPSSDSFSCTVPMRHVTDDFYIYFCGGGTSGQCPNSADAAAVDCDEPLEFCPDGSFGSCITIWICREPVPTVPEQYVFRRYLYSEQDTRQCDALIGDQTCTQTIEVCTNVEPTTRTIEGVLGPDNTSEVTLDCWEYSRTYDCQTFTPATDCTDVENDPNCTFQSETCLSEDADGKCTAVEKVYRCPIEGEPTPVTEIQRGEDIYCLSGECDTITREPDTNFKDAAVALQMMNATPGELQTSDFTIFDGERLTCPKTLFGAVNCCTDDGLLVDIGLASCSSEAKLLAEKKQEGLCHYVGTYCSSKVLGVCVKKRKAYCCFNGKLTRLIMEEAHRQLNLDWGEPKKTECDPLTIAQFQQLDFAQMDFSEIYEDAQAATNVQAEEDVLMLLQSRIEDYYATNP